MVAGTLSTPDELVAKEPACPRTVVFTVTGCVVGIVAALFTAIERDWLLV